MGSSSTSRTRRAPEPLCISRWPRIFRPVWSRLGVRAHSGIVRQSFAGCIICWAGCQTRNMRCYRYYLRFLCRVPFESAAAAEGVPLRDGAGEGWGPIDCSARRGLRRVERHERRPTRKPSRPAEERTQRLEAQLAAVTARVFQLEREVAALRGTTPPIPTATPVAEAAAPVELPDLRGAAEVPVSVPAHGAASYIEESACGAIHRAAGRSRSGP